MNDKIDLSGFNFLCRTLAWIAILTTSLAVAIGAASLYGLRW